MIRMFRSKDLVEAIEFSDWDKETISALSEFTGMAVNIELSPGGTIRAGLIRDATSVHVVNLGEYVYKDSGGTIGVCDLAYLKENYEEVTEQETEETAS